MQGRVLESPIGRLGIWGDGGTVTKIVLHETREAWSEEAYLLQAEEEILEYFAGKRKEFSFPYSLKAKGFQKACLEVLMGVPYGKTVSYGKLAEMTGIPGGARAVGNAMHNNPLPIRIPCHRVIKADGTIGGFGGGVEMKKILLSLEGGWSER